MNIILLGKLLVGGGLTAAGSVTVWLNWDKIAGYPYRDIVIYAKADSSNDTVSKEIKTKDDFNQNNYRCRWAKNQPATNDNELFLCSIKQLKEEDNPLKNHFKHDSFEDVKKDKIKTEGTIIQISFKSNKPAGNYVGSEKIEIVAVDTDADKGKKYGIAGIWFIEEKDKEITTKYFIVKAKSTAKSPISSYKCSWSDNSKTTDAKSCEAYVFDSSASASHDQSTDYLSLTFAKSETTSTSISEHHYYLVKWEEKQYADSHKDKMTIFATTNAEDASEEKIQFEKVKPSFLVGDKLLIVNKKGS